MKKSSLALIANASWGVGLISGVVLCATVFHQSAAPEQNTAPISDAAKYAKNHTYMRCYLGGTQVLELNIEGAVSMTPDGKWHYTDVDGKAVTVDYDCFPVTQDSARKNRQVGADIFP